MVKAKFISGGGLVLCLFLLGREYVVNAEEEFFEFNGDSLYKSHAGVEMSKGVIHYFSYNKVVCNR